MKQKLNKLDHSRLVSFNGTSDRAGGVRKHIKVASWPRLRETDEHNTSLRIRKNFIAKYVFTHTRNLIWCLLRAVLRK